VNAIKAKTDKWNCIYLKSFCIAKEIINRVKKTQKERWFIYK
jgi:hypothetical protein